MITIRVRSNPVSEPGRGKSPAEVWNTSAENTAAAAVSAND